MPYPPLYPGGRLEGEVAEPESAGDNWDTEVPPERLETGADSIGGACTTISRGVPPILSMEIVAVTVRSTTSTTERSPDPSFVT